MITPGRIMRKKYFPQKKGYNVGNSTSNKVIRIKKYIEHEGSFTY